MIVLAWVVLLASAQAADELCPVCGNRYTKNIYRATRVGSKDKVLICEKCAKLDTVCYICRLPVARNYTTCADGRLICREDAAQAVMDQETAEKLFDRAMVWCQTALSQYGALPNYNLRMSLEAKAQLDRTGNLISDHPDALLMGVTRTRRLNDQYEHVISLLHGLIRPRFLCVSVHEYAHSWLHENLPRGRRISAATVEGFCEWLAYKYAVEQHLEQEQLVMSKNPYSRGQIHAFLAAEKEYDFYRVVQWMKFGADSMVDADDLTCIIRLTKPAEASERLAGTLALPEAAPVAFTRPAAPDKLLLKGISGTAARRFALINDQTFMAGEQAKVKLGTSNVVVRCLEIRERSVVVQMAGGAREELGMEK